MVAVYIKTLLCSIPLTHNLLIHVELLLKTVQKMTSASIFYLFIYKSFCLVFHWVLAVCPRELCKHLLPPFWRLENTSLRDGMMVTSKVQSTFSHHKRLRRHVTEKPQTHCVLGYCTYVHSVRLQATFS